MLLNEAINEIKQEILNTTIFVKACSYKAFGSNIEKPLLTFIGNKLKEKGICSTFVIPENKNDFPDLVLDNKMGIELKCGCSQKVYEKDKKDNIRNSENDLGTILSIKKHLEKFNNNVYILFVNYRFISNICEIVDIEFHPFYKKVGVSKDKTLKYRLKDGNLRPTNFGEVNNIPDWETFYIFLEQTRRKWIDKTIEKMYDLDKECLDRFYCQNKNK